MVVEGLRDLSSSARTTLARSDLWNGVLLAAIPFLLLLPFLWNNNTLLLSRSELGTDYLAKQLPNATFLQQEWGETRRMPTWRPGIMSGIPIVGNPSYLTAYPPYLLILFLPVTWTLNLLFALHTGLAGVGIYAFSRVRLGFSGQGAFASAVAYMLAPKILAHVSGGQLDVVIAFAWSPFVILGFDRALEKLSLVWGWVAGLLFGLVFVAHPPSALLILVVLLAYCSYLMILRRAAVVSGPGWGQLVGRIVAIGIAATAGFLLVAAAHLSPMLDLLPYLHRSDLSLIDAAAFALPPSLLALILAIPTIPFPEWIIYIGLGVFVFASRAILHDHVWGKPFWLALGLTSVLFALGTSTPLFGFMFRVVPGFAFLRVPSRTWFFVGFVLAIFCGAGVESFVEARGRLRPAATIGLVLLAATALVVSPPKNPWHWVALAAAVTAGATIMILDQINRSRKRRMWVGWAAVSVLVVELSAVGWSFWRPGESPPVPHWLNRVRPDVTGRVYTEGRISPFVTASEDVWTVEGIDPVQLDHYVSFIEAATNCQPRAYSVSVPAFVASAEAATACTAGQVDSYLLGLLSVGRVVTSEDQTDPGWVPEGSVEDGGIFRNTEASAGAFIVYETQPTAGYADLLDRLAEISASDPLLVEGGRDISESENGSSSVDIRWITSDQFELEITTSATGFVVASVPYMPGWKAFDQNGVEQPVHRAQMALMGTYVPVGKTILRFEYSPDSYAFGKWVRGVALVVSAIGLTLFSLQVWKKRHTRG